LLNYSNNSDSNTNLITTCLLISKLLFDKLSLKNLLLCLLINSAPISNLLISLLPPSNPSSTPEINFLIPSLHYPGSITPNPTTQTDILTPPENLNYFPSLINKSTSSNILESITLLWATNLSLTSYLSLISNPITINYSEIISSLTDNSIPSSTISTYLKLNLKDKKLISSENLKNLTH
jgi:hypothetical protein